MSLFKKIVLTVFVIMISFDNSPAQSNGGAAGNNSVETTFNQSSLPIVVINTNGQTIPDSPKIIVDMGIINNGPGVRNYLTDPYNEYDGKIAIEIRGSSSQVFPKKSWGFDTKDGTGLNDNDVSIFGMPSEHKWILSANYTDKSFCRNVITYQLSNEMGHYAVRTKFVDVVLNGTYVGIYVFMEAIKRDKGRVDIAKLHTTEITPPDVTGGYIIKIDKTTGSGGAGWTSNYSPINHPNNQKIYIQYDYPSTDSIVVPQSSYIKSYVDSFENALSGPNFNDSLKGYSPYIGNGSWIDYFFCNELSKNVDGYRISAYLYKDKNKTLKAGPVWDYDIAWGNANYCSGSDTTGWAYLFPCTGDGYQVPFWWQKLLQDTNYTNEIKCRWTNYRQNVLSEQHIQNIIDSIASVLNESTTWNFTKWPILGTYVWPNPSPQPSTYAGEIQNLKNWVHTRLNWLDANMPGHCSCSLTTGILDVSCNSACDGQAIALGVSPYQKTYLWSDGNTTDTINNLCPGVYSLTLNDKIGCTKTVSINISQPSPLLISSASVNTNCSGSGCNGSASVIASGGSAPYTYSWSSGQTAASVSSLCQGIYTVTVSDNHACRKRDTVTIQNPSAPVISLTSISGVSCNGSDDGSATVNVSGGTGPYSFLWWPSGGNSLSASGLSAGNYTFSATDSAGCYSRILINIPQPAPIAIHTTVTNAVCFGGTGSASANVTGGILPYNFSWSPGGVTSSSIIAVQPGTYSVFVTDHAGCSSSSQATISQPDEINLSSIIKNPSCHGGNDGTVAINVTGGNGTFTYSWLPSGADSSVISGLNAGNYIVTIKDISNCTATMPVVITDPPPVSLSVSSTEATCNENDGTATVNVINGTTPIHYSWFPGGMATRAVTDLNTGNYTVTISDSNGCMATDTVYVGSTSGLIVSITGKTRESCYGMNDAWVTLNVLHGSFPYSFSWASNEGRDSSAANLIPGNHSVTIIDNDGCSTEYRFNISEPAPLSITVNSTPVTCFGFSDGKLSADVSGGTSPYYFNWPLANVLSQTVNNLSSGNYNVNVTDSNGCSATASATVTEPLKLSVSVIGTNTSCGKANGSAIAIASGGSGAYHYSWTTGDTNSFAGNFNTGNYYVTVTDLNGCSMTDMVTIGGTSVPVISVDNIIPVTCNGGNNGSATIETTGGTGLYSYTWIPDVSTGVTANNLSSGNYTVIVTDANRCHDSTNIIIPQPAPLAALILSENVKCFGGNDGMLFADAGGGSPPYSYSWSDGQRRDTAFNLSAGTYSIIITDANNCSTSASGTVMNSDVMSVSFMVTNTTCLTCSDGSIITTVNGGTSPYSYSWQPVSLQGSTITNLPEGNYFLCVTDANNCVICDSVKLSAKVTAVQEINKSSGLYVYPNPLHESTVFAFTLNGRQFVDLRIFSSSGQLIRTLIQEELDGGEQLIRFNASELSPGIYYYRFTTTTHFQAGALVVARP